MTSTASHVRTESSFHLVTERWTTLADPEQRRRAFLRYCVARAAARGGNCLEVACGTGYGLPFFAQDTRLTVGVDVDWTNLMEARERLPTAPLVQADAGALPF